MKVVIAIDSFKGSLSTTQAGEAAADGIRKVFPEAATWVRPIADGGEGTVDALTNGTAGTRHTVTVTGPLGTPVEADYGIFAENGIAVIEMAAAAGITLVPDNKRNPLYTTTYGVGELIAHAIQNGCRRFIIGIGGSATNDGGVGMLQALGFGFYDEKGCEIPRGAAGLRNLHHITADHVIPHLEECRFNVACDVKNVLCGATGCSAVYGPQKGATPEMIAEMDELLKNYAGLTREVFPDADPEAPGAGAAGGLGYAFRSYLHASLEPGCELIMRETALEDYIKNADVVVTGEGRLDSQTQMGKAPVSVAALAKKHNKPVLAFAGCVTHDAGILNEHGIDALFPILHAPCALSEAMDQDTAALNLSRTAEQAFRIIKRFGSY